MSASNKIRFLVSAVMVVFLNMALYAEPYCPIKADKITGDPGPEVADDEIIWRDATTLCLEGQGWENELLRTYDRLPAKAEKTVPKSVWNYSRENAGISVRFITNATSIHIRYALKSPKLSHGWGDFSPMAGSSFDIYGQIPDPKSGELIWQWAGGFTPKEQSATVSLCKDLAPGKRLYLINFPNYNGVEKLEVGIPLSAKFEEVTPRKEKAVVFYGTSIMQGGAPSRPGLAIPSQIGRKLGIPVINMGLCGCGKMDKPVAELLAELDPAIYVIDCLPNMNAQLVKDRTDTLVRILRKAHANTPILLVEEHDGPSPLLFPEKTARIKATQEALHSEYDKLIKSGIKNIYYLAGQNLIGHDSEGTGDGVHPNDIGTFRYVAEYEKALTAILKKGKDLKNYLPDPLK